MSEPVRPEGHEAGIEAIARTMAAADGAHPSLYYADLAERLADAYLHANGFIDGRTPEQVLSAEQGYLDEIRTAEARCEALELALECMTGERNSWRAEAVMLRAQERRLLAALFKWRQSDEATS